MLKKNKKNKKKNLPTVQETQVQFLGQEDPLEKGITTLSSILAWTTPWTEECGSPWGCKDLDMTERLNPAQHSDQKYEYRNHSTIMIGIYEEILYII